MAFGHMVYFQLKDNAEVQVEAMMAGCKEFLTGHAGTVYFGVGRVADADREVNDREFDVALHLVFESEQAHDDYQVASRHLEFVEKFKECWKQVRVFDSVVA